MKISFISLFAVFLSINILCGQSKLQLIHNSPDPSLQEIVIEINDSIVAEGVRYRSAVHWTLDKAAQSYSMRILKTDGEVVLESIVPSQGRPDIVVLLNGLVDVSLAEPNPDGVSGLLDIVVFDRTVSTESEDKALIFASGCIDCAARSIVVDKIGNLGVGMTYNSISGVPVYLPSGEYRLLMTNGSGTSLLKTLLFPSEIVVGKNLVLLHTGLLAEIPGDYETSERILVIDEFSNSALLQERPSSIRETAEPSWEFVSNVYCFKNRGNCSNVRAFDIMGREMPIHIVNNGENCCVRLFHPVYFQQIVLISEIAVAQIVFVQ